jgi:hypothetical protein
MEVANMLLLNFTLFEGRVNALKFPYPRQFAALNCLFICGRFFLFLLVPYGIMEEFEALGTVPHILATNDAQTSLFHRAELITSVLFGFQSHLVL